MKVSFLIIAKFFRRFDALWNQIHSLPQNGPEFEVVIILDRNYDIEFSLPKFDSAKKHRKDLNGSFSGMRNYGIGKCTGDWIFHIDTDELLPEMFVENYEEKFWAEIRESNSEIIGFPRINDFTFENNASGYKHNWPDFQWRLHGRLPGIIFQNEVHETLGCPGFFYTRFLLPVLDENAIIHIKNLHEIRESEQIYMKEFNKGSEITLQQ